MKYIKLFENYDFESKYKKLIVDIKDILLELSDIDIKYEVDRYITITSFQIYINIYSTITNEQKGVVKDVIYRLNDFLKERGLNFYTLQCRELNSKKNTNSLAEIFNINKLSEIFTLPGEFITLVLVFENNKYIK